MFYQISIELDQMQEQEKKNKKKEIIYLDILN